MWFDLNNNKSLKLSHVRIRNCNALKCHSDEDSRRRRQANKSTSIMNYVYISRKGKP